MNEVLKLFLAMSGSGTLLILALFLGKRFWKDKISRQWQYYIWLPVIFRLLVPFGMEINLTGKAFPAIRQAVSRNISPQPQPAVLESGAGKETADPAEDRTEAHPFRDLASLLAGQAWLIWLAAALGMLIRKRSVYQSFVRFVTAGAVPVSDPAVLDLLSITEEQLGIKKPVELCVNPQISSPLFIGFFHPCIVLPDTDISKKDFQYIVMHELTHYKRLDMFYKWLVQICVCLHWFNPFVHFMSREITRACEFSCDEAVLGTVGCAHAQDYGKTLLDAMAAAGKYKGPSGVVSLNENKKILKERLTAIVKYEKKTGTVRIFTGLLTACVVFGASFVDMEKEVQLEAEYRAAGITNNGTDYYYRGQLVNVFMDLRPDQSFYTLAVNPDGEVSIKTIRGADGQIRGAAYMAEAEVEELLRDME